MIYSFYRNILQMYSFFLTHSQLPDTWKSFMTVDDRKMLNTRISALLMLRHFDTSCDTTCKWLIYLCLMIYGIRYTDFYWMNGTQQRNIKASNHFRLSDLLLSTISTLCAPLKLGDITNDKISSTLSTHQKWMKLSVILHYSDIDSRRVTSDKR